MMPLQPQTYLPTYCMGDEEEHMSAERIKPDWNRLSKAMSVKVQLTNNDWLSICRERLTPSGWVYTDVRGSASFLGLTSISIGENNKNTQKQYSNQANC